MINTISLALSGLHAASRKVEEAAGNIARYGTDIPQASGKPETDLATETVNMTIGKTTYKANAMVMQTATDMEKELGRLFDERV